MGIFANLLSKKMNRQVETYQQELVQTHYQEVENMYRQMRGWRHDWRNHLQALKIYAAKGDLPGIQRYLDELDTSLSALDMVIKTGNPMTDAILNSKISLAKNRGISVMADAHIPVKLRIPEIDLCCILGNLFDNAIEASAAGGAADPRLHGHEGQPAVHLVHQLHRRQKDGQARGPLCHHQGCGAWTGSDAHRQHCGAAGRLCQPQLGGRSLHHRNPAAAAGGAILR